MKIGTDGVLLGAWAAIAQASRILDIGTGTGVLALMAAQRNTTAQIDAIEIDEAAYQQAFGNVSQSDWKDRVEVFHSAIQDYQTVRPYDLIISNPPYFDISKSTAIANQARNIARTTSALSFDDLLLAVVRLLSAKGLFCLVLPYQEGKELIRLAEKYQLYLSEIVEVAPREGKDANRLLIALRKEKQPLKQTNMAIRKAGKDQRDYTLAFEELHRDFLLHL